MENYFTYVVVFHGSNESYNPIIYFNRGEWKKSEYSNTMHLFDQDLNMIPEALNYIFHLPRLTLDLFDQDEHLINSAYDEPHNILVVPDYAISMFPKLEITLAIVCDGCNYEEIKNKFCNPSTLGIVHQSDLSIKLLKDHWNKLYDVFKQDGYEKVKGICEMHILKGEYTVALPLLAYARQYNVVNKTLQTIYNSNEIEKSCLEAICRLHAHNNTLIELSKQGLESWNDAKDNFDFTYKKEFENIEYDVVITLPGNAPTQQKYGGVSNILPENEKNVIRAMGVHRAIAKDAMLIELPCASPALFRKLNELELHCKNGTNNQYVWKMLNELGKLLEQMIKDYQMFAIMRAKHITIFSDFPLGLAVIGGVKSPLQLFKSISYRPLTPLTRSLEMEMPKEKLLYWKNACKVVFAECIPATDDNKLILKMSALMEEQLIAMEGRGNNFRFVHKDINGVHAMKMMLKENIDADILIISAHGAYNPQSNMAGLMLGDELWMADDNDVHVPPVVILSACHSSPRGGGAVNVADLLRRMGAMAVLSSFVPLNAYRNTILITRLFTYIVEAQRGSRQYNTLSDAWTGITSTNAIHEMIQDSPKFREWIYGKDSNGKMRMSEFQQVRSVGRLHPYSIYQDTITVIKEMLADEGMERKFANILDGQDYYPESLFYQWTGYPENIFLYNDIFEKVISKDV